MVKGIRALTLKRPWPWAIYQLGKPIENRVWRPAPDKLAPGDPLLIHSGKGWDKAGAEWIETEIGFRVPPKNEHPTGLTGWVKYQGWLLKSESRWFQGPIGWQIPDPHEFERPIECSGRLGLWIPPPDAIAKLPDDLMRWVRDNMGDNWEKIAKDNQPHGYRRATNSSD